MNTPSSPRKLRHREADLAGLLSAAERVFSDRGYHATSIRDIAREAGFSVGGVYQFFASKDELYLRVVEEQWEHFFELLSQALLAETSRSRLLALSNAMFRAFEERRGFFKLFLSERGRLSAAFTSEIAARVGQHTRRLRRHIVELMAQCVADGVLRPLEPELLASAYMGMVHSCIFEALATGAAHPTRSPEEILTLFLDGAATRATPEGDVSPAAPARPEAS
ncbi:MAG: TetR/AcrR family transcriptional regulator [Acidobacteriota bacterium]